MVTEEDKRRSAHAGKSREQLLEELLALEGATECPNAGSKLSDAGKLLRKSEAQFRALAEIGNDWFWETDSKHRFVSFFGYSTITGLPAEGTMGIHRWDNASARELRNTRKWDRHKAQLENHEKFRNFEFELKNDPPEWITVSGTPVFDDNGTFTGYQGTASTISRQKATELLNNRLVAAFNSLKEIIVVLDADDRFVFCNRKYRDLNAPIIDTITPGKSMEGHVRALVEHNLEPGAIGREEEWINERLERLRNPGEPVEIRRNDGTWYLIHEQKLPDGGLILLGTDITDLKEAHKALEKNEQRFREFAESTSDWLWETNRDLQFTFISQRSERTTGLPVESMLGKTRREIFGALGSPERWQVHLDDLDAHRPFRDYRFIHKRPDGEVVTITISGKPVFDTNGEFDGYLGTGSDITERERTEDALQVALAEAERANKAKSEFLATMSHEFRTPLNAILGFSQMLKAQFFGPLGSRSYEEYAEDIHFSGEHMLTLVNDVLDIAAIEAGKRNFLAEKFAIEGLLQNCLHNVTKAAEDKGIQLSLETPQELPEITTDRRSVTQIFQNLLSNAIKFTGKDDTIAVDVVMEQNDWMRVVVRDTGAGIPADKLSDILEPFVQVETDPLLTQEGSGLGLSIVKSLVDNLEGSMSIDSEVGKGTHVTIQLPLELAS